MKQYITIILAMFLLVGCGKNETPDPSEADDNHSNASDVIKLTDAQLKNMILETTMLSNTDLPVTIKLNAKAEVAPQNTVSITNAFGGYVKRIALIPGNYVTKGQIVVILEDPQYIQSQEDYLTTKAFLEQANADYNRQKDLNASQAASDKVLQQAKATRQTLMVKKSALEQRLRLMNINPAGVSLGNIQRTISVFSPISGIVSEVNVNMGQYVSPASPMLEIINPQNALLNIRVFEKDLSKIEIGQSVKAFTNSQANKKAIAEITSISRDINEDGTVNVYAKIINDNGLRLSANMYFNIELQVSNSNGKSLPESAVVSFEGKDYVFEVLKNNEFKLISIEKGSSSDGRIEILSDLPSDKKYITKGSYNLLTALKNEGGEEH